MHELPVRSLGHSPLSVPAIGLGCNNFGKRLDRRRTAEVLDAAIATGVTFLDTADRYGETLSETFIGEALKDRRGEVLLATKFGAGLDDGYDGPRGSAAYITKAVDASLTRLQTDVIDLYWYHRPDGVTPIEETLTALHQLVLAGKVRAIGASNFTAEMIAAADRVAREHELTRFCAIQNEYSLIVRDPEADVLPTCERLGIAFIPYFPLYSGLLTGKYHRDAPAPAGSRLAKPNGYAHRSAGDGGDQLASAAQWATTEAIVAFAEARGLTPTQVAIGALLGEPAVASVIAGATTPQQVVANAAAADWIPDPAELAALRDALS